MTFGRDIENVAGDLHPVTMKLELAPDRIVEVRVKNTSHWREVEFMVQAPGTKKWYVVTSSVVRNESVEFVQVLKELFAEVLVELMRPDIRWRNGPLKDLAAPTLNAVAEHVPEGSVK